MKITFTIEECFVDGRFPFYTALLQKMSEVIGSYNLEITAVEVKK